MILEILWDYPLLEHNIYERASSGLFLVVGHFPLVADHLHYALECFVCVRNSFFVPSVAIVFMGFQKLTLWSTKPASMQQSKSRFNDLGM